MEGMDLFEESLDHKLDFKDMIDITAKYYKLVMETEGECLPYDKYLRSEGIRGTIEIDLTDEESRIAFERLIIIYMESDIQVSLKSHPNSRIPAEIIIQTRTKGFFKKKQVEREVLFKVYSRYEPLENVTKVYIMI